MVPDQAKVNGVKLRFWQSNPNDKDRPLDDWAIDSLIIDTPLNISARNPRQDLTAVLGQRLWWRTVNVNLSPPTG